MYNLTTFKPAFTGGKWEADITHFTIGRLTIPPSFAKLVKLDGLTLGALSQVFEKETKGFARMSKIEPGDRVIRLTTKPQQ